MLRGSGYKNSAFAFEQIKVRARGGSDKAKLHDAVLERARTADPPADAIQIAWLYDFELIRERSDSGTSTTDAVDEVFAAYW